MALVGVRGRGTCRHTSGAGLVAHPAGVRGMRNYMLMPGVWGWHDGRARVMRAVGGGKIAPKRSFCARLVTRKGALRARHTLPENCLGTLRALAWIRQSVQSAARPRAKRRAAAAGAIFPRIMPLSRLFARAQKLKAVSFAVQVKLSWRKMGAKPCVSKHQPPWPRPQARNTRPWKRRN